MFNKFSKTIAGFVTQFFEREGESGVFKCTSQEFTCGDDVNYEGGKYDEELAISERNDAIDNEVYQPCDMVSPLISYYYLQIWECVEMLQFGPFETEEIRDEALKAHLLADGKVKYTHHRFELPKGIEIKF